MATQTKNPLEISLAAVSGPQREINHEVLQPILTDLIALSLIVKQLHWNVTGPNLRPLHLHLDEIYEVVTEGVDRVAERLTATGHSPNGTLAYVSAKSELTDPPTGFLNCDEVVMLASERIRETSGLIRSRMETIEEKDTVTADLLHQIVAALEKHHWMLQAQRIRES